MSGPPSKFVVVYVKLLDVRSVVLWMVLENVFVISSFSSLDAFLLVLLSFSKDSAIWDIVFEILTTNKETTPDVTTS